MHGSIFAFCSSSTRLPFEGIIAWCYLVDAIEVTQMNVDKRTGKSFRQDRSVWKHRCSNPYAWNEDTNWRPLWDAIREVADHKTAGRPARPHFMGAIVMDQLRTVMAKVGNPASRDVFVVSGGQ